jgi:Fungal protein of unknown function (DUF2015)
MSASGVLFILSTLSLVAALRTRTCLTMWLIIVLWVTRHWWLPHIPSRAQLNSFFSRSSRYVPIPRFRPGSFTEDLENGFSSDNFDISENITSGDTRGGLDENDKAAISRIMAVKRVGFDEERRILAATRMEKNGIDPKTGRPLDPRAVMFS